MTLKKLCLFVFALVLSFAVATTPAFAYSGTMKTNVCNQTDGAISGVNINHDWEQYVDKFPLTSMKIGECGIFNIEVGSGGHDYWSLRFNDQSGKCLYRQQKQCDIYSKDLESGKAVNLNLLPENQGFSIEMPASSSCTDNHYDDC